MRSELCKTDLQSRVLCCSSSRLECLLFVTFRYIRLQICTVFDDLFVGFQNSDKTAADGTKDNGSHLICSRREGILNECRLRSGSGRRWRPRLRYWALGDAAWCSRSLGLSSHCEEVLHTFVRYPSPDVGKGWVDDFVHDVQWSSSSVGAPTTLQDAPRSRGRCCISIRWRWGRGRGRRRRRR